MFVTTCGIFLGKYTQLFEEINSMKFIPNEIKASELRIHPLRNSYISYPEKLKLV